MRLTVRTNLAMRVLMYCAANDGRRVHSADVSTACNASANHVAQVVNLLSVQGFVRTVRGRGGGLQLGRPATEIAIGEVFRAFESGVPVAECFSEADNTCPLSQACRLRDAIARAIEAFYRELDAISLDELVCGNTALIAIFNAPFDSPAPCRTAARG